ncbi:hypothetical protein [Hymenobacter siberiensis]|jgi:hypothetical protein|nr:hypothetical protein [Hymenobacter siberiensis]MBU6122968.1 hypothetical protein [Hymenobacter siberiensis]
MPANLQSVATANRIIPKSRRDKFFDALEGAFTGEGIGVDRAGADECLNVVGRALYVFRCSYSVPQEPGAAEDTRHFFTTIEFNPIKP